MLLVLRSDLFAFFCMPCEPASASILRVEWINLCIDLNLNWKFLVGIKEYQEN